MLLWFSLDAGAGGDPLSLVRLGNEGSKVNHPAKRELPKNERGTPELCREQEAAQQLKGNSVKLVGIGLKHSEHCFSQQIVGAGCPEEGLAQIHGQQGTERMDRTGGSLLEVLKSRLEGARSSWSLDGVPAHGRG